MEAKDNLIDIMPVINSVPGARGRECDSSQRMGRESSCSMGREWEENGKRVMMIGVMMID